MVLFEPGAPAAPDSAGWNVSSAARALGLERASLPWRAEGAGCRPLLRLCVLLTLLACPSGSERW
jgi:hypothetical protein